MSYVTPDRPGFQVPTSRTQNFSYVTPDRLAAMMATQRAFQQRVASHTLYDGIEPRQILTNNPQRIDEFKDMVMALQDELHEALGEIGWRPWATSRHFNVEAVQGELVDAWCFLMSLMLLAGLDAPTLYRKYMAKMAINHKRQDDRYDGVAGKCPNCKRALDDPDVACYDDGDDAWCADED